MKQMTLVFCALMIFPGWASTQDLILTKGNSEKKFPAGQFVLVSTLAGDTAVSGLCSQNYYYGKLLNSEFGVLTIQVSYSHTPLNTESLIIGTGFNRTFFGNTSDGPIISIPKDEVIWVRKSGKNKPKNNNTGETIGGSLALAGFVVLTVSLIEENVDSRSDIAAVGATMIFTGWILGGVTHYYPRYIQEHCSHKKHGKKLWAIQ